VKKEPSPFHYTVDTPKRLSKSERQKVRRREKIKARRRKVIVVSLAVITTICAAFLAYKVILHYQDLAAARREMAELQKLNPMSTELLAANPDYAGWLIIGGTDINYPVVRGSDNDKYLNTTFSGKENAIGAIFIDYRSAEDAPHLIIYGHNSGSLSALEEGTEKHFMFGGLRHFLDGQYMAEHPEIMFVQNNVVSVFEIFSVRETDINDAAYMLDFSAEGAFAAFAEQQGAPEAEKIITLSTCIGDGTNDGRLLVQGVLQRTVIVNDVDYNEDGGWHINLQGREREK